MDWTAAIECHRAALLRLLAAWMSSVERASAETHGGLPRFVRTNVGRVLRPAESAVRRLVFVTAQLLSQTGFSVRLRVPNDGAARAVPEEGIVRGDEARLPAFALFDRQKNFEPNAGRRKYARHCPRIWFFDGSDPEFEPYVEPPVPLPDDTVDAARLLGRLEAMKRALEDIPKQAKRLLRVQARRERNPPGPGRAGPLRPGFPPGHSAKPMRQVDEVLRQCAWLARRVVEPADTS